MINEATLEKRLN